MFSLTIDFSLSNWFLWFTVKSQVQLSFTCSLNWWVCSDSCGINLLRYEIIPKEHWKSCLNFGKAMSLIALFFSGSGETLFLNILCPKNINSVGPKTHLSLFSFKPHLQILFKTYLVWMFNWFRVDSHMMISPLLFLAPSKRSIISSMSCWKTSLALCIT